MSKNYQKAARGWLYALAVVIAGTWFGALPAQSATCFLPSGECSTGKIGPGPGPTPTPEYCNGYNITEKEYNAKYKNTSCFNCSSPCTKTSGGTFYKCEAVNNTTWDDDYNVCCTNGTKYDADDGKCCAGGKCDHPCEAGKQWSPTFKQCVCPSSVETDSNGNCCASGQVLENGACTTPCEMNPCGDYPYTSDPGNSESCDLGCGKGMRYKCQDGYTYSGGKCVEQCAASGYTLTSEKDSHCYSCTTCPTNSSKYKCTESVKTGYQLVSGVCSKIPETEPDPITCPSGYTTSSSCATDKGFTLFEHPNYAGCYQCQCRNQGQINGKCTNCSAEGYTQTQTSGYVCTDACPIDSNLFKPSSCTCTATCPDGYSSDKVSVSSCGVQGPGGWNFESKTVCGRTCGKCTAKTCPAGYDTTQKSCPYPTSSVVGGYSGNTACTKCSQSTSTSCPSGAYATQSECQQHVPTLKCFGNTYTGACKKGSISGCWKPFQTVKSKVMISCSGGTCNVGYCLSTNASTSGYYGSACVKIPNSNTTQWKSETSGFNYSEAGIVSCEITTSKKSGTGCASSSTSASSTCYSDKTIGSSPYELDDGKW